MVCRICKGENITQGVSFTTNEMFDKVGPKYKDSGLKFIEETICDICNDCGEILRIYVRPSEPRKWVINTNYDTDILSRNRKLKHEELTKIEIEKKIEEFESILRNKTCTKKYIKNLNNYHKHELFGYPIKTQGPSYHLYREKVTQKEVLIKKVTMHLDKGEYLVCEPILKENDFDTDFSSNNY